MGEALAAASGWEGGSPPMRLMRVSLTPAGVKAGGADQSTAGGGGEEGGGVGTGGSGWAAGGWGGVAGGGEGGGLRSLVSGVRPRRATRCPPAEEPQTPTRMGSRL